MDEKKGAGQYHDVVRTTYQNRILIRDCEWMMTALEGDFGCIQYLIRPYRRCIQDRLAETIVLPNTVTRRNSRPACAPTKKPTPNCKKPRRARTSVRSTCPMLLSRRLKPILSAYASLKRIQDFLALGGIGYPTEGHGSLRGEK